MSVIPKSDFEAAVISGTRETRVAQVDESHYFRANSHDVRANSHELRGDRFEVYSSGLTAGSHEYARSSYEQPTPADPGGVPEGKRPLRVVHVGPSFVCAGVETWLRTLHREFQPQRVRLVHHAITDERFADRTLLAEAGIPWSLGVGEEFTRACREADVLMIWGPIGLVDRLPPCLPPLTVFVAHGVSSWTMEALASNRRIVDHVIAVSEKVAKLVPKEIPCTVILNGVNPAHLTSNQSVAESRSALGFAPDDFVVGYVGRFSPEKQIPRLIDALALCERRVKFLCVGWGPLRADLMDRCNSELPGRYVFREGRRDLGNFYQSMDAFCFPSREEGYGLAVAEAMYCGIPVISTDVGGVPELIQNRIQGLVVQDTPEAIRDAIESLRNYPEWRKGIAAEGRSSVHQKALGHQMARQYEQLLLQLWRDRRGGR